MSNNNYDNLFDLDFKTFEKLVYDQDIEIDEDQLLIIYNFVYVKNMLILWDIFDLLNWI